MHEVLSIWLLWSEINKANDWLMMDDSRAIFFLAKDEKLKKYLAEEFLNHYNQGGGSQGPN